ncbi:hypothetical protein JOD24_002313 [Kroppenstedtia sanguinis]|uniref:Serine/threonine protein kinase n=1 Tax=Kroppenstedtia sanguinis TaxID=1380684 RepID=A0ABW4C9F3_9BACL
MFWSWIQPLIENVKIQGQPGNQLVTIFHIPNELEKVGIGTDAVVVRHPSEPQVVFKCYAPGREQKRLDEYEVYRRLGDTPYFPVCFGMGDSFLVLSHERGPTLYECVSQGIVIPENIIAEVEAARRYVRNQGLNPRDLHLKNILLQEGHAKLLDVSEYLKPGDDARWDHLVQGYRLVYPLIRGRKIPVWLMERVKKTYFQQVAGEFSVSEFARPFLSLLHREQEQDRP